MTVPIGKLRGMTADIEAKLRAQGIFNSDQLLELTRTPSDRQALAETLGVESRVVLELANRADLARVKGIGGVFSDLLEHAGVDTVKELATRRPDNLYATLVEVNDREHLAGRAPTQNAVESWVEQARALPKLLEY